MLRAEHPGDEPDVAERVADLAGLDAARRMVRRPDEGRAGVHRPIDDRIDVVDLEVDRDGGPAERLRPDDPFELRVFVGQVDLRGPDPERRVLYDKFFPIYRSVREAMPPVWAALADAREANP